MESKIFSDPFVRNGATRGYLLSSPIPNVSKERILRIFCRILKNVSLSKYNVLTLNCIYVYYILGEDDQEGALKLLFYLLCVQPKKGDSDRSYLFSQHEVNFFITYRSAQLLMLILDVGRPRDCCFGPSYAKCTLDCWISSGWWWLCFSFL